MKKIRAALRIRGRVQGVNFRYHTRERAEAHGLTGWVRNVPDGDVEAVFEGEESEVEAVVEWCHRGPASARVDHLEVNRQEYRGEFEDFTVRR